MDLAGIRTARLIAFTFPDPAPALSTYMQIKGANANITVIARAKIPFGSGFPASCGHRQRHP